MSNLIEQMVEYYRKNMTTTSPQSMFPRLKKQFPTATDDDFFSFITAVSKASAKENGSVLVDGYKSAQSVDNRAAVLAVHNRAALLAKTNSFKLTNTKGKGKLFFS